MTETIFIQKLAEARTKCFSLTQFCELLSKKYGKPVYHYSNKYYALKKSIEQEMKKAKTIRLARLREFYSQLIFDKKKKIEVVGLFDVLSKALSKRKSK